MDYDLITETTVDVEGYGSNFATAVADWLSGTTDSPKVSYTLSTFDLAHVPAGAVQDRSSRWLRARRVPKSGLRLLLRQHALVVNPKSRMLDRVQIRQ